VYIVSRAKLDRGIYIARERGRRDRSKVQTLENIIKNNIRVAPTRAESPSV
jgi:hypothetical protein